MEIGSKIKALRQQKGITQEALAAELNVSAQAVSKWECELSLPDVALLPEIAVYFGVTVDELFSLPEDKELERIQNMVWDEHLISPERFAQAERRLQGYIADGHRKGDCYDLLAQLYNHQSDQLKKQAAEFAKTAMEEDPDNRDALSELNNAMGGYNPDWNVRNHHELIAWLKDFCDRHPDKWHPYLWLMDNLMEDKRFDEADKALEGFAKVNSTFRVQLYRGLIAYRRGNRKEASAVWKQMERDFPAEWLVCFSLGDIAAEEGRFDDAIVLYRKGSNLQEKPRFTDFLESIADIEELRGNIPAAIAAYEEELEIFDKEWHFTTGETADVVRREIERLKKKL